MIKILYLSRSSKAYLRLYDECSPDIRLCCENCGIRLHKHGRYYRSVTTKQEMLRIPIYRQYCPDCGTTVSLLPDFLVPWARFATWVREAAMIRRQKGFSWRQTLTSTTSSAFRCSRRTMKRWWKRFAERASSAAMWVAGQLTRSGYDGDLLGMYPKKVNPELADTLNWLQKLLSIYCPVKPWRRGYWTFLNLRLPVAEQL
jgi:hypothetical protein